MTAMKFISVFAAFGFLVEASQHGSDQPYFSLELETTYNYYGVCHATFKKADFDNLSSCLYQGFELCIVECSCSSGSCTASFRQSIHHDGSQFGCRYYSCSYSDGAISCLHTYSGYACSELFIQWDSSMCDLRVIEFNWNNNVRKQVYFRQPSDFVSCGSNCSCPSTTTKPTTRTTKSSITTTKRTTTTAKPPTTIKTTRTTSRKTSTRISTRPTTMKPSSKSSTSYTGVTKSSTISRKTSSKLSTSSSTVLSTNDTLSSAASEPTSSAINSALIAGLTVPAIILSVLALVGGLCFWRQRKFPKKSLLPAQTLLNNVPSVHSNHESSNIKPEAHYSDQYFNVLDNNVSQEETKHVYQNIANEDRKIKNKCSHASGNSSIESQPTASDIAYSNAHSLVESNYVNCPSRDNGHVDPDAVTSANVSRVVISLPCEDGQNPDTSIYFTIEESSSDKECVTNAATSSGVSKNVSSSLIGEDGQDSGTIYFTLEDNPSEFVQHGTESAGTSNPSFVYDEGDFAINKDITHKRTGISPDNPTINTNRNIKNIKGVLKYQNIELDTNAELEACEGSTVAENEYEPIGTELTYEFVNPCGFSSNPKVNVIHETNDDDMYSKANSNVYLNSGAAGTKPVNAYSKLKDVERNIKNPYDMSPEEIDIDHKASAQRQLPMDDFDPYSLAEINAYTFGYTDESDNVTRVVSSVDA